MMPTITFGSMKEWQYIFCMLLSFLAKSRSTDAALNPHGMI
jgi:hypothetical protein